MCTKILAACVFLFTLSFSAASRIHAMNINVQYAPGTLFYSGIDATAKASINKAAADISDAITSSLNAITSDLVTGTYISTTANFDARFFYTNPSTGLQETIQSATLAADEVRMFVGTRNISTGNTLGVGGAGGVVAGLTGANGPPSGWVNAVADGEAQLNSRYSRGSGPIIGTSTGSTSYGFPGQEIDADYMLNYGANVGNLWFDTDEDNNGSTDSVAALDEYWHWNYNTPVDSGKNDLYSVAVHEILHALGIGASTTWNSLVSGTTWNGSEVQTIVGSGANLINLSGDHVAANVMSMRISDGMKQEVVMDPTITVGSRKELTLLDLAFLRDIGYQTIMPTFSSPPDFDSDGDVDADDLMVIQDSLGIDASGDADTDGDTDGNDFLIWQQQYTGPNPFVANVPEPTGAGLLTIACLMLGLRRP